MFRPSASIPPRNRSQLGRTYKRHPVLANGWAILIVALLLGCENETPSKADDDGNGDGDGDGDGMTPGALEPVPAGPGLNAAVGGLCPVFDCNFDHEGLWNVSERCDHTGTWNDPSCPSATFEWEIATTSGTVEFYGDALADWRITQVVNWSILYPSQCGSCEAALELLDGIDNLSCDESGGGCACSGQSIVDQDWEGTVYHAVGDGAGNLVEFPDSSLDPPEHPFTVCAGTEEMIIYDEIGARIYLQRVFN